MEYFQDIFKNKEEKDYKRRCYPNTSYIEVFQYKDDPLSYEIRGGFEGIRDLIQKLDLPSHANRIYCSRLCSGAMFFDKTKPPSKNVMNYTVEQFGPLIYPNLVKRGGAEAGHTSLKLSGYIYIPFYWYERPDYRVQVWRTRIFPLPVAEFRTTPSNPLIPSNLNIMHFEERWHPYRGKKRRLTWIEPQNRFSLKREKFIVEALSILGKREKRGRKPLDRGEEARAKFISEVQKAYSNLSRIQDSVTQISVAVELDLTPGTFRNRLNSFGLTWSSKFFEN